MAAYKLFTHTDLDGIGCGILAQIVLLHDGVDIEYINPGKEGNETIANFLDSNPATTYTKIFITDLSISDESVADDINEKIIKNDLHVVYLDHHVTSDHISKYDWAKVSVKNEVDELTCGTELLLRYFFSAGQFPFNKNYNNVATLIFVECVRLYDTWDWKRPGANIKLSKLAENLNDLFRFYGTEKFSKMISTELFADNRAIINDNMLETLDTLELKKEGYIKNKMECVEIYDTIPLYEGYTSIARIYAENHISEIGSRILDRYPEISFVEIINMARGIVSLRSSDLSNVDVSIIAKKFNGGGHARAAGFKLLPKDTIDPMGAYYKFQF